MSDLVAGWQYYTIFFMEKNNALSFLRQIFILVLFLTSLHVMLLTKPPSTHLQNALLIFMVFFTVFFSDQVIHLTSKEEPEWVHTHGLHHAALNLAERWNSLSRHSCRAIKFLQPRSLVQYTPDSSTFLNQHPYTVQSPIARIHGLGVKMWIRKVTTHCHL